MRFLTTSALYLLASLLVPAVHSLVSYANDFVDPDYVLGKTWNASSLGQKTSLARESIVQWADDLSNQGPWSVMNKTVVPPNGDKHTYMSWAPYSWPNCTGVGNTTELPPEQIWKLCPYYTRDGLFNPDVRLVNDTGEFQALGDAVLYNALAWVVTGNDAYASKAASFVNVWFLDPDTAMAPNLDFAQGVRGPGGSNGTHTGVLDLKGMVKITNGLLILRKGNSSDWTSDLDTGMRAWVGTYTTWLETSQLALEEAASTNNHGSFYFNQLAAVKLLVNDQAGAQAAVKTYFDALYQNQIVASGEQPFEAARTRPYHYRAYNLAAMITNARLGEYAGTSFWQTPTKAGATIQTALDFALTTDPGSELASELYPNVAAVGATYGDPTGKYAAFLKSKDEGYVSEAYFFWDQPLSDSGLTSSAAQPHGAGATNESRCGVRAGAMLWIYAVTAWTVAMHVL